MTRAAGDFTGANVSTDGDPEGTGNPQSQIVAGTAVLINATAVDLDTHIVVGPPTDWSASLPSSLTVPVFGGMMQVNLATYSSLWQQGMVANPVVNLPVNAINMGDSVISASFDARTNQITLNNVKASGGSGTVRIEGALMNTNDLGNIQVNAGYGHVTISNQTAVPLDVQDIYTGSPPAPNAAPGIIDLLDYNTNVQTMYVYLPGQGINVYTGSNSASMDALRQTNPEASIAGNQTSFDPEAGLRLEWQLQATLSRTVNTSTEYYTANNWIFNTPSDPNNPWQYYNWQTNTYQSADLPDSRIISVPGDENQFQETITGSTGNAVNFGITYFNYDGFTNNDNQPNPQDGNKVEPGSTHDYSMPQTATLTLTMSVRADNPVGIVFAGHDSGLIDITSNASVYLDGTLTNPTGDTNITVTNGSILEPSNQSSPLLALACSARATRRRPCRRTISNCPRKGPSAHRPLP